MSKCSDLSSSKLRRRITIQRRARTADGEGGFTEVWTDYQEFAYIRHLFGFEQFEAQRVASEVRFKAFIHFRGDDEGAPFYNSGDRVLYRGREYSIEYVADVEDRQMYLELFLVEGRPT